MYKIPKCQINNKKNEIYIKIVKNKKELAAEKIKIKQSSNLPKFGRDITNFPKYTQTQISNLGKTRKISRKASSYNKKSQNKNNPNKNNRNKKIFPNRINKVIMPNGRYSFEKNQNENSNILTSFSNLYNYNYYSINMNNSIDFRKNAHPENSVIINKNINNTIDNNYFDKRKRYKVLSNRTKTFLSENNAINYIFKNYDNNKLHNSKNYSNSSNNYKTSQNSYQFNSFHNSSIKNNSQLKNSNNKYYPIEGKKNILLFNQRIKSFDNHKKSNSKRNLNYEKIKELSQEIKKVKKIEYPNKKSFALNNNNNHVVISTHSHIINNHRNVIFNQNNIKKEKKINNLDNSKVSEVNPKNYINKIIKQKPKLSLDLNSRNTNYLHAKIENNKEFINKYKNLMNKKNKITITTRNTIITSSKINSNLSVKTDPNITSNQNTIKNVYTNLHINTDTIKNTNVNNRNSYLPKLAKNKVYNRRTNTNYDLKNILQIEKLKAKKNLTNKKSLICQEMNKTCSSFITSPSESTINLPKYIDISHISDPQIPKEYLNNIYYNLLIEEKRGIINKPYYNFMDKQKEINEQMRGILIDWIIDVHYKFGFTDETLFMTVLTIDRYLTANQISRNDLQLLGIASLMIACKHEEIDLPKSDDFIYITDNAYTKEELFKMEDKILMTVNFCLLYPSPIKFFEYLSKNFNFTKKMHFMGKYLMESFLLDIKYVKYNASIISCACTYIVMKLFQNKRYRESYDRKYYLIGENDEIKNGHGVKDCAQDICFLIDNISESNLQSCFKKYASEKLEKVSLYIEEK